jgi:uncharacterized protein
MNSSLYTIQIMHQRLSPLRHGFNYRMYMFYIDLEELPLLHRKLWMFSVDRFNFFAFRKKEHLQLPRENPDQKKMTREHVKDFLKQNNFELVDHKIMLLSNLNILGYNFNPVSFYFILHPDHSPACAIAEVGNTFGELKPYYLSPETLSDKTFYLRAKKYFYVSPFFNHDTTFEFRLQLPAEKLQIHVNDFENDQRVFVSTLTGDKEPLTNLNLLFYFLRFPLVTLRVITLIHWQAFRLFLKKLPFHKKAAHLELQQEVFRKYESK